MFKRTLTIAVTAVILAGCNTTVTQPPANSGAALTGLDLKNAAASELKKMFASGQAIDRGLDEYEVIYRAVMHNLESRLRRLESTFAGEMLIVDNLAVLPAIANNAGYSTSQVFGDTDQTSAYQVSSSFDANSSNLAATWNVLDMAMGYYSAKLNSGDDPLKAERERRAGMDIVRHAKEAYWRAYAAQRLNDRVENNLKESRTALEKVQQSVRAGSLDPLVALQQRKRLLESMNQLEALKQELEFASLNLSQVVNARPGEALMLKDSPMSSLEVADSVDVLEKRAYAQNPDIREFKTRESFTISEAKKVSAYLFPTLPKAASLPTSGGESLPASEWAQYGLNVGWNLIKLANEASSDTTGVEAAEARAIALRIAVLAKTHIAYESYRASQERYQQAQELYEIEALIAEQSRNRKAVSVETEVENLLGETSAIAAELRRYDAYARLVSAYETLQGTVGDDSELVSVIEERNKRIADVQKALAAAEADLTKAESQIEQADAKSLALRKELTALSMSLNQIVANLVTARSQSAEAKQVLESSLQTEKTSYEEVTKLDSMIAAQTKDVSAARAEVARISATVESQGEILSSAEQKLASLNAERQLAVQQVLALNERESQLFAARLSENQEVTVEDIRQVTADREAITARMESLNGLIKDAQAVVLDAQAKKSEVDRELSSASATEAGIIAKLQVLTSQRSLASQKATRAAEALSRAQSEDQRLDNAVAVAEAQVESIKVRQEEIRAEVASLTDAREASIANRDKAEKAYFEAEDTLGFLLGEKN